MNHFEKNKPGEISMLKFLCVLFLAFALTAMSARAQEAVQGMETINLPIEAAIAPTTAAPGIRVKITGKI